MNASRRLLLALGLLAALPAAACITPGSDDYALPAGDLPSPEGWVWSDPFPCGDFDLLWEEAKVQACRGGRWRIDDDATMYARRRVVTAWWTEMGTMGNSGRRRRRFVEFAEEKEPRGYWRVGVATVNQRNADVDHPLDPAYAEWKKDAADTDDAETVVYRIESRFRDFGPSKEFELK